MDCRVVLLAAFKVAMDGVEATAPRFNLETFRAVRLLQYDALLMRESMADKATAPKPWTGLPSGKLRLGEWRQTARCGGLPKIVRRNCGGK